MKETLKRLLFPPRCISCGELLPFEGFGAEDPRRFCESCRTAWDGERGELCSLCGHRVDECVCVTEELRLAKCKELHKLVYYNHRKRDTVQNRVIYRIKDTYYRPAIDYLASEMAKQAERCMKENGLSANSTVIVYLPRGRLAAARKGTDQGKRLAYGLSRYTGLPVEPVVIRRRGSDRAQKKLGLAERRKNAKLAYGLRPSADLLGKTVLLVDDLVTTGVSMAVVIRMLRHRNAKDFYAFAVASDDINRLPQFKQPVFRI